MARAMLGSHLLSRFGEALGGSHDGFGEPPVSVVVSSKSSTKARKSSSEDREYSG